MSIELHTFVDFARLLAPIHPLLVIDGASFHVFPQSFFVDVQDRCPATCRYIGGSISLLDWLLTVGKLCGPKLQEVALLRLEVCHGYDFSRLYFALRTLRKNPHR